MSTKSQQNPAPLLGAIGAIWGLFGVVALLALAISRLLPYARELTTLALGPGHVGLLIVWTGFMVWTEGYRGFHRGFCPRVAARARFLRDHPRWLHVLLAPPFCIGYFHATRRRRITSISVTLGIVLLVQGVKRLPQPWRGIVDVGVLLGLGLGIVSLLYHAAWALRAESYPFEPQVPEAEKAGDLSRAGDRGTAIGLQSPH